MEVYIFVFFLQLFEDLHRFLLKLCLLGAAKLIQEVVLFVKLKVLSATWAVWANDILSIEVEKESLVLIVLHLVINLRL